MMKTVGTLKDEGFKTFLAIAENTTVSEDDAFMVTRPNKKPYPVTVLMAKIIVEMSKEACCPEHKAKFEALGSDYYKAILMVLLSTDTEPMDMFFKAVLAGDLKQPASALLKGIDWKALLSEVTVAVRDVTPQPGSYVH